MTPTANPAPDRERGDRRAVPGHEHLAAYRAVERGELPTIRFSGRKRVPTLLLLRLLGYEVADLPSQLENEAR